MKAEYFRRVTFRIITETPLPAGEQVFISGNDETLGSWAGAGFPLSRIQDNCWSGTAMLPHRKKIKFKITRGDWQREEVLETQMTPPNKELGPGNDTTVEYTVIRWKDSLLPPAPLITGDYEIHRAVESKYLKTNRDVIVWLPPSYKNKGKDKYPVLYMQDGQQLFDPNTSTWQQAWDVDDRCTELIEKKQLKEIIVVAIYSTDKRTNEYDPAVDGKIYGRFIIEELKPFIDKTYRTRPERASTAIAGSSMGGAISFFIAWSHPDVFFGAACISPAFRFGGSEICLDIVRDTLTVPDIKCFLYCGNSDPLEKTLMNDMRDMAKLLRQAGYKDKKNLLVVEIPEGVHKEESWAAQTETWLKFLFGRKPEKKTGKKA